MNADEYLSRVRRSMAGMEPSVRNDILRELGGHIRESAAADGGSVNDALARLGPPEEVGRGYRELYGYGRLAKLGFIVVGIVLAVFTVPVLGVTEEALAPYGLSIVFLIVLVAWLLGVSVIAGSRVGLFTGAAAAAARVLALAFVALTQTTPASVPGGLALFIVVSGILPVLGWLPGTARKAWRGPRPEL